ncbi:MAG: penicillin amidase [Polyangiales bacterium]|jgi:penicillin amidase
MRFGLTSFVLVVSLLGCGDDADPSLDPDMFAGVSAPVRVRVDQDGVQHIDGANALDVHFASGYEQATGRLFQMDMMRRQALGRQGEVWADRADGDELIRTVNLRRLASESAVRMRQEYPEYHSWAVAWTAGVNRRIDEVLSGAETLPSGFGPDGFGHMPERWTVDEGYAVAKLILFGNSNQIQSEILATLMETLSPEVASLVSIYGPLVDAYVLPPEERPAPERGTLPALLRPLPPQDLVGAEESIKRFIDRMRPFQPGASNNWAVAGRHSFNGRPLIAGDPHQSLSSPAVFHMQHLRTEDGVLDVVGFGFVGTPGIQLGHSDVIAWTATTSYPDWMDLVDVAYDGAEIMLGGVAHPVVRRVETIGVSGGADVELEVLDVPGVGVLLADDLAPLPLVGSGRKILLRWVGFEPTVEAAAFFAMNRANNLEEFGSAVDMLELGAFNFIYADAASIAYRSSPAVPDRGLIGTYDPPWRLIPGDNPANVWTGARVDLSRLPRSEGGERGWIATANNDPFGFTGGETPFDAVEYFGVFFDPGTRAARIEDELARLVAAGPIDVEAFKVLQHDTLTPFLDLVVPPLSAAMGARATDDALIEFRDRPNLDALLARLEAWDGRMDRDSSEALIFHILAATLCEQVIADDLPLLYGAVYGSQPLYAMKWAFYALDREIPSIVEDGVHLAMLRALDTTATFLEETFPDGDYTWGEMHVLNFPSPGAPFDRERFPMDGANGTVNVADVQFRTTASPDDPIETRGGAVYRMVTSFDESGQPEAEYQFLPGNGGDPADEHWDDLQDDWRNGVYRPMLFDDAAIEANLESTRMVLPL